MSRGIGLERCKSSMRGRIAITVRVFLSVGVRILGEFLVEEMRLGANME
jgi:hypothetical protein